jgi:tetratricopeptide (TPR) repeat protein
MACVDGVDLKTLLVQEGRIPLRRALRILSQVGSALDAAHARALVHRDVKPANILVADGDRAFLSDFGVAKELGSNGTTRTGSFVGTTEYSAPEQIEGRAVDGRADVYALACVLYECLAGTPPFHRPSELAVLNAHLHAPPPKLTKAAPDLPAALEPVIAKALSKSPLDRYPTCGEFVAAARAAAAEPRIHRRRLAVSLSLLLLCALAGAAIALGVRALAFEDHRAAAPLTASPPPRVQAPPVPSPSLDAIMIKSVDGRTLNDVAFHLLRARQWARALPFARKAVRRAKAGSLTRAYATFNLGYALYELGRCREGLVYFRRALKLEPKWEGPYIRPWINRAELCLQRGGVVQGPLRSSGGQRVPSPTP